MRITELLLEKCIIIAAVSKMILRANENMIQRNRDGEEEMRAIIFVPCSAGIIAVFGTDALEQRVPLYFYLYSVM